MKSAVQRALAFAAGMLLVLGITLGVTAGPAHAVGTYDNANIATTALSYVGKNGTTACADANKTGGDQCKQFVNCIVWMASGHSQWPVDPGGDYQKSYADVGGVEVAAADAKEGDIIQMGQWDTSSPLHTAIVVSNEGAGKFTVVDANYNYDGMVNERSHWTPFAGARFWRLGTVVSPPPPADSDGDGVPDSQDPCPHQYGKPNGCPVLGDMDQDGRSDVSAFYNYDGNVTNLWTWAGQNRTTVGGPGAWSASGWDGTRDMSIGKGDFNGDGKQDLAAFFRQDSGVDLNIWYGDGHGALTMVHAWHGDASWQGGRIISAGAGDFNHDGRTDIAAFYRYDNNVVGMDIWYGQSSGFTTNPTGPWSGNGWDGTRIIPDGVGDYNGDGNLDIGTFYRHDGGMVDLNVWYGDGVGNFTLGRPWHVDSGWDGNLFIPAGSGDFNHDGKTDLAIFFNHTDTQSVDMRIWYGTSNGVMAAGPGGPWAGSGWEGSRILPAGVGDYDGDGNADIATFYAHNNGMMDMNVWYGDGHGNMTLGRPWHVDSGWEGVRLVPIL